MSASPDLLEEMRRQAVDTGLNAQRKRWYGLRIGDIVEQRAFGRTIRGEVVLLGLFDNNAVLARVDRREAPVKMVAEWCHIVTRVEDRQDG